MMTDQEDANQEKEATKRMTELLALRMSHIESYHDHKETMAHGAILVTLALVAGILGTAQWPPAWIPAYIIWPKTVTFAGVTAVWLLVHVYMRWQLQNRRLAAIYVEALMRVLQAWAISPPSADQLKPCTEALPRDSRINRLLDLLMTGKRANVIADENITGYPTALVNELQKAASLDIKGEFMVTSGSFLLYFLLVLRTIL